MNIAMEAPDPVGNCVHVPTLDDGSLVQSFATEIEAEDREHDTQNPSNTRKASTILGGGIPLWDRLKAKPEATDDQVTNEGDEEENKPAGKKINAKFKLLARMIKTNLIWTKELKDKVEKEDTDEAFVVRNPSGAENLIFDASNFKSKNRSYGGLTAEARRILLKHPIERTDDELLLLAELVDRLKCFDKYPPKVKHELARVIFYEHYNEGRIIIQQGHVGQSFYFIVSGRVVVSITEQDKTNRTTQTQILAELSEGSSFGELALMHNIKRGATIRCKGNSEFLRVDKDDFEEVLRASYEREFKYRMQLMSVLPQFAGWPQHEITTCNNTCKLKEYGSDKVVVTTNSTVKDFVFIIVSGQCRIVRQVVLLKRFQPYGGFSYELAAPDQAEHLCQVANDPHDRRQNSDKLYGVVPELHYWSIGTVGHGFTFGVGEKLKDTYFVTKTKTEMLLVPRVAFARNRGRALEVFCEELTSAVPNTEKLYTLYSEENNWRKYKCDVVDEVVGRRTVNNNTRVTDVPYAIRDDGGNRAGIKDMKFMKQPAPQSRHDDM